MSGAATREAAGVAVRDPGPPSNEQDQAEARLWQAWREARDPAAREELVLLHLPYARKLAMRMYRARPYMGIEYGEFHQFACVGLLESLDRYDPARGAAFRTFALPRIEGSVLNGLAHLTEVNEQVGLRRRMQRERLASLKGEPAGRRRGGGQVLQELSEIAVGLAIGLMLEDTAMYRADEDGALADTAYSTVAWRQASARVRAGLQRLPPREQQVLALHYLHGLQFEQIAGLFELSKGRISQLHRQGLRTLRAVLGAVEDFSLVR